MFPVRLQLEFLWHNGEGPLRPRSFSILSPLLLNSAAFTHYLPSIVHSLRSWSAILACNYYRLRKLTLVITLFVNILLLMFKVCIAYMLLVSTCMYVAIYRYCCTQNTRHDFYRLDTNQPVAPPFCHNYYPLMHGHIQCASIHPPLPHLSFLPYPFYFLSSSFVMFSSISSLSLSPLSLLFLGTDS